MTSTVAYPWSVRYLPAKRACTNANDIPKYEAMTDDQKKVFGGLWWSMHDIIEEFGGFVKQENDANYFNYIVDFSSKEMVEAKLVDPDMVNTINTLMTNNFNNLSNQIQTAMDTKDIQAATNLANTAANVAANRPQFGVNNNNNMPMPALNQTGAPMNGAPEPIYSARNLQTECLKNVALLPITSKSRVFVVQKDFTPATQAMIDRVKTKGDFEKISEASTTGLNLDAANAQPGMPAPGMPAPGMPAPGMPAPGMPAPGMPAPGMPAPMVQLGPAPGQTRVGGVKKTRRGRKYRGKKRVTRRRQRR